jgi:prepilin-type N-terminal cleavage/methylation domain-containing protein
MSNNKKGFSLMEILIAMFIFGIIAMGLALPFQESITLTSKNTAVANANNLARLYLKDTELIWQNQLDFDNQTVPELIDKYTENGLYTVNLTIENLATNKDDIFILKRINIIYSDKNQNQLINIFMDYSRPGKTN